MPPQTTKVRLGVLAILGLNLFLAIAALLFAFIQSRVSSRVDGEFVRDDTHDNILPEYEKGRFTSEIWACSCFKFIRENLRGKMEKACAMHSGARWLTLTTLLFSAALFVVAFFDSRREGHILYAV